MPVRLFLLENEYVEVARFVPAKESYWVALHGYVLDSQIVNAALGKRAARLCQNAEYIAGLRRSDGGSRSPGEIGLLTSARPQVPE